MANRKRKRATKYVIQHGKLQHVTTARRFTVWVRAGLLVAIGSHTARVSDGAKTTWENGELHLAPSDPPSPSIGTNASVIDSQYIFANDGKICLSRADRLRILHWRFTLPPEIAAPLIRDFLNNKRDWDMCAQYGW